MTKEEKEKKDKENILRLKELDKHYIADGNIIAGVDEAGRGPLAGPVVVAAVILHEDTFIEGIDDSKKLTEKKRKKAYDEIKEKALAYSIIEISEKDIDRLNILEATKLGVKKAVESLDIKPEIVLTDALRDLDISFNYVPIIKGDAKSYSIAAASILAKVHRDERMKELAEKYPEYSFEKHKGYGTKMHYEALKKYGMSEIHRKTFVHLDKDGNRIKRK